MPTAADPLTLVLPVRNAADRLPAALAEWSAFLQKECPNRYDILVVDDGSTDGTAALLDQLAGSVPRLRRLAHDRPRGFGACLRTALAEPTHPVVCLAALDYPYSPADLPKLLKRLGETAPVFDVPRTVEAVSGCRIGRPAPAFWRLVGATYRVFGRIALGIAPPRLNGWLGLREHARSWWLWLTMGVPLTDVHSAFKVFDRAVFDRFPIQSDSDFALAEIFAKLTFLSVLVAEEPLTPKPDPVPPGVWGDFWAVFKDARFYTPLPDRTLPPSPPLA